MTARISDLSDFGGLDALRAKAAQRDPAATEATARQFETLFAEQLVKSMRQTSMGDAMFPGQSQIYRELYDREIARRLAQGKGLGLAPQIRRSLEQSGAAAPASPPGPAAGAAGNGGAAGTKAMAVSQVRNGSVLPPTSAGGGASRVAQRPYSLAAYARHLPAQRVPAAIGTNVTGAATTAPPSAANAPTAPAAAIPAQGAAPLLQGTAPARFSNGSRQSCASVGDANHPLGSSPLSASSRFFSPDDFVAAVWPHAQRAAAELGVSPRMLVAQAALETGWGKHVVGGVDASGNNLFGIKAGGGWQGATVQVATQEYAGGQLRREIANFRGYASLGESFDDYVRLIKTSPRYQSALAAGQDHTRYAQALQRAGYATDPAYAAKLTSIANGPVLDRALKNLADAPLMASR